MNLRSVNVFKPIGRRYQPADHAHKVLMSEMKPLFVRAKAEGLFFRNRDTGKIITWEDLSKKMRKGQCLQGPQWWHLINAQGQQVR